MTILEKLKNINKPTWIFIGLISGIIIVSLFLLSLNGLVNDKNGQTVFAQEEFPFVFSYPTNWSKNVSLSKDREKKFDVVKITSPDTYFTLTIISSQKTDISGTRAAEPIHYLPADFVEVPLANKETLLFSQQGGIEWQQSENILRAKSLNVGDFGLVYRQVRNTKAESNIHLFESSVSKYEHYLNIQFSLAEGAQDDVWIEYKPALKEILSTIKAS